jgi:hypothetical protein
MLKHFTAMVRIVRYIHNCTTLVTWHAQYIWQQGIAFLCTCAIHLEGKPSFMAVAIDYNNMACNNGKKHALDKHAPTLHLHGMQQHHWLQSGYTALTTDFPISSLRISLYSA